MGGEKWCKNRGSVFGANMHRRKNGNFVLIAGHIKQLPANLKMTAVMINAYFAAPKIRLTVYTQKLFALNAEEGFCISVVRIRN